MSSDNERYGDDGDGSREAEADARSIAAQNLSDLECGDDAAGSPVAYSPSNAAAASASIDRQNGIPGSIHTGAGARGTRSAPGSRSSSRTPTRPSSAGAQSPSRIASRSKPNSRSGSRSRSKGGTTPEEINAERERRRIEALAMIREVDSRRNVLDLGPAVPPPPTASSGSNNAGSNGGNGGGGLGVGASIRNLFGSASSTAKKTRATKQTRSSSSKKKGARSVSETLAVHAGQWGGAAPFSSSSSAGAQGGRNASNANPGRAIASSIDEMMMSGMG